MFVIECRMNEERTIGCDRLADVESDAGVPAAAVPVAPVPLQVAEKQRDLIGSGLDFLQANDIRTLTLDPLVNLRVSRPDAVDVPGGDLQWLACAA
jgi:hypothetical protein